MPRSRWASLWLWPTLLWFAGCADNAMVLKGKVEQFQQQQLAMSRQQEQLHQRATALDRANQELESLLAQSRQQAKVLEDQLSALRDQLRNVTTQLAQAKAEKADAEKKIEAMTASMRRQGGVAITPNNSLAQTLPSLGLPPNHVRLDGDCIRVTLPASQLFEPGTARLRAGAATLIAQAGNELARLYPEQIIGIEGHTDPDPVPGGQFRNNHELSAARALAVYEVLITQTRLQPGQLFVVGHGPNHPFASNATPEGKESNRRIELVVYPEKKG